MDAPCLRHTVHSPFQRSSRVASRFDPCFWLLLELFPCLFDQRHIWPRIEHCAGYRGFVMRPDANGGHQSRRAMGTPLFLCTNQTIQVGQALKAVVLGRKPNRANEVILVVAHIQTLSNQRHAFRDIPFGYRSLSVLFSTLTVARNCRHNAFL